MTPILLMLVGILILVAGAELLVRASSRLAESLGVTPLVVGLTVVAFGTSAPELAISVSAALHGQPDLAMGNAVGSNIFNVLLILGISALIIPLTVDQKLIRFDVPLMILVSLVTWSMSLDGQISRLDGGLLFLGLLAYLIFCIRISRQESPAVQQEYDEAFGLSFDHSDRPLSNSDQPILRKPQTPLLLLGIIIALSLLVFGSRMLTDGASQLARIMGVSELVIGLTIVAAGTSVPELVTSVVAAFRGERDIAVGNVIGSNLFNLLGVLGLSSLVSPTGVAVSAQSLTLDLPVMTLVAFACLPVFFTGHRIDRWEGAVFLAYFVVWSGTLTAVAVDHHLLPSFRVLMTAAVLPITLMTLLIAAARSWVNGSLKNADRDS